MKSNYLGVTEVNFGQGPFDWEDTTVLTPPRVPNDPGAELWHRQWQYCGTWSSPSPLCFKWAWTSSSWGTQATQHLVLSPPHNLPHLYFPDPLRGCGWPSIPPLPHPRCHRHQLYHRWLAHMFGLHTRWFSRILWLLIIHLICILIRMVEIKACQLENFKKLSLPRSLSFLLSQ